jgi:hypothetical protein
MDHERDCFQENQACNIHQQLLTQINQSEFDPFAERNLNLDNFRQTAISRVHVDDERRRSVKGPSIKRDKFSNIYWRDWNNEKKILERMTEREISGLQSSHIKNDQQHHVALSAGRQTRNRKGTRFSSSKFNSAPHMHFDTHLLSNTDVNSLVNNVNQSVKGLHQSKNSCVVLANLAPSSRDHIQGGVWSSAIRSLCPQSITRNCDYPASGFNNNAKGAQFSMARRFEGKDRLVAKETRSCNYSPRFDHMESKKIPLSFSIEDRFPAISHTESTPHQPPRDFPLSSGNTIEPSISALNALEDPVRAKVAAFGFSCDRQQHILFGMCLDGRCAARSLYEKV